MTNIEDVIQRLRKNQRTNDHFGVDSCAFAEAADALTALQQKLEEQAERHAFMVAELAERAAQVAKQQGELAAVRQELEAARKIREAAENLVKVRGRHHTEIAYQRLITALDAASQQAS